MMRERGNEKKFSGRIDEVRPGTIYYIYITKFQDNCARKEE